MEQIDALIAVRRFLSGWGVRAVSEYELSCDLGIIRVGLYTGEAPSGERKFPLWAVHKNGTMATVYSVDGSVQVVSLR